MSLVFSVDGAEAQGGRDYQEDFYQLHHPHSQGGRDDADDLTWCLGVVCDGMGGHAAGDIASAQACLEFVAEFKRQIAAGCTASICLYNALESANRSIGKWVGRHPSSAGMGCTLLAVLTSPEGLRWISVGDSILFLIRGNSVTRLNADHSYMSILKERVEAGEISLETAKQDPRRNQLLAAVMGEELPLVNLQSEPVPLLPGDHLLLASDGVETLLDTEIASVVATNDDQSESPKPVSSSIIEAVIAENKRNQDNVTVVHMAGFVGS